MKSIQVLNGLEHLGFSFVGQSQNDMYDDGNADRVQALHGSFKAGELIASADKVRRALMDGLQTELYLDKFIRKAFL